MAKKDIKVYTNMDNFKETNIFSAIVLDNVIKYIDLVNNKFVVNYIENILIKENDESIIKLDFNKNIISIFLKEYNKEFIKYIKTISSNFDNNIYYVKYKLIDENVINEYQIEFL